MKRKQMYKRIAAVFVSAAMLMGSMSMAYAEEPATEAATETEVISSEETSEGQTEENAASSDADTSWMTAAEDAPDVAGLECTGKLKLDYATGFDVYYYENDYALIDVHDSAQYLLVPDGQEAPDGLASDVIVLQKPLNRIYLAASSAMALFRALDSLDCIKMTGIDASGWYIQEAKDAIEEGAMQFAGKYSEPDYEMLVDEDCDVAIESTMILHTPKVQEMIENLGTIAKSGSEQFLKDREKDARTPRGRLNTPRKPTSPSRMRKRQTRVRKTVLLRTMLPFRRIADHRSLRHWFLFGIHGRGQGGSHLGIGHGRRLGPCLDFGRQRRLYHPPTFRRRSERPQARHRGPGAPQGRRRRLSGKIPHRVSDPAAFQLPALPHSD